MTDHVTAAQAVIEAANAYRNGRLTGQFNNHGEAALFEALDDLASATSPDLDALIAEVLPCTEHFYCGKDYTGKDMHNDDCYANLRPAVRDLIVSLLPPA
jgi:uncharacterized protein (DUF1501 family)